MADFLSLLKSTAAYGAFSGEVAKDRVAHAYLIVHPDDENLINYLKIFAKDIVKASSVDKERAESLIENGFHPDVKIYPAKKDVVLTEDVADLINESYIKPIESGKKVFIINRAETMNASAQNKLLKTLEEPPKNAVIILGATSEYPLLATVKSRVRKLIIPEFSESALKDALKDDCPDAEKLKTAIACGNGTVGKTLENYRDEKLPLVLAAVIDVIVNMQSSKDVLLFTGKIAALKVSALEFISVMKTVFADMLKAAEGKSDLVSDADALKKTEGAKGFTEGALVFAIDSINESEKRLKFNVSEGTVIERLLFSILEGKYKWRKS